MCTLFFQSLIAAQINADLRYGLKHTVLFKPWQLFTMQTNYQNVVMYLLWQAVHSWTSLQITQVWTIAKQDTLCTKLKTSVWTVFVLRISSVSTNDLFDLKPHCGSPSHRPLWNSQTTHITGSLSSQNREPDLVTSYKRETIKPQQVTLLSHYQSALVANPGESS